jgi:hypothetical protein
MLKISEDQLRSLIDIAPMPHPSGSDHQRQLLNAVDDSVVSSPHPILALPPFQLMRRCTEQRRMKDDEAMVVPLQG